MISYQKNEYPNKLETSNLHNYNIESHLLQLGLYTFRLDKIFG